MGHVYTSPSATVYKYWLLMREIGQNNSPRWLETVGYYISRDEVETWRHITWFTCAFISPMSCRSVQLYYESWNCFSNSKRIFVVGTLKSDFNLFVFVYFAKCQNGNAYFLFVCFFFNSRYKSLFKWNHCRVPNSGVATGWQRCPRLGDRDKKKKKRRRWSKKKKKKKKEKKKRK